MPRNRHSIPTTSCVYMFRYPLYLLQDADFGAETLSGVAVKLWVSLAVVSGMGLGKIPAVYIFSGLTPDKRCGVPATVCARVSTTRRRVILGRPDKEGRGVHSTKGPHPRVLLTLRLPVVLRLAGSSLCWAATLLPCFSPRG